MRRLLVIILACSVFGTTGCAIHRIDIQQGNIIDPPQLDRLGLGMSQDQVRFLLGTPAIRDPFHPDRWDYLYYFRPGDQPHAEPERRRLTLYFKEGRLTRIDPHLD